MLRKSASSVAKSYFLDERFFEEPFFDERFFDERFFEERFFDPFFEPFFDGTFPPSSRASDRPIAIACFLLVTFFPERPLFNVPCFRSCIAFSTFSLAFLPYLAIALSPSWTSISSVVDLVAHDSCNAGPRFSPAETYKFVWQKR